MDADIIKHSRSIYTILDFLGDLGGLYDALRLIGSGLIFLYSNFVSNEFTMYLVRSLSSNPNEEALTSFEKFRKAFNCCLKQKEQRRIQKVVAKFEKELDVLQYVKM